VATVVRLARIVIVVVDGGGGWLLTPSRRGVSGLRNARLGHHQAVCRSHSHFGVNLDRDVRADHCREGAHLLRKREGALRFDWRR
jgi:hypothetical protein